MYIYSSGLICSVGHDSKSASAAFRAGIKGFSELPFDDSYGSPIIGAKVHDLQSDFDDPNRIIELSIQAISDCTSGMNPDILAKTPILFALSEKEMPGGSGSLSDDIIAKVENKLHIDFHNKFSKVFNQGNAAGYHSVEYAKSIMAEHNIPTCLICGVDSLINGTALQWLEINNRLKTEQNSDGVIPGEAAAAILLTAQNRQTSIRIRGVGTAFENSHCLSDEPLLGLGLTTAAKAALDSAQIEIEQVDFRLSDVSGESYSFKEHALMIARVVRVPKEDIPLWHCAESIGSTGAASGICQLIVAQAAFQNTYAPGNTAMCCTSSDFGARAILILENT